MTGRKIKLPPWCHKMSEWQNWLFSPRLGSRPPGTCLISLAQPIAAEGVLVVECQNQRLRTQAHAESDGHSGFGLWTLDFLLDAPWSLFSPTTARLCLTLDHLLFVLCSFSISDENLLIIKLQ